MAEALWDRTTGTNIGDMINNGGLAAAFDGNLSQSNATSSIKANAGTTGGYVGKDFGSGNAKPLSRVVVRSTNNIGLSNTGSVTLSLYGSNSAPSNPSNGTLLGTNAIGSIGSNSTDYTVTSSDTTTTYRYAWVKVASNAAGADAYCCELSIYITILSYSLTASGGSSALTGQSSAFRTTFASGPGAFIQTGQAALFKVGGVSASGAFTLNGQPMAYHLVRGADAGSFALSGQSIVFAPAVVSGAGTLSLSGFSAAFLLNYSLKAGSFLLNGQPVNFPVGREDWLPAPDTPPELWTGAATQSEPWTAKVKQGEVWTARAKQSETWTPRTIEDESWTVLPPHGQ